MPVLTGTCSVDSPDLDIVLAATGVDFSDVPLGSWLELESGATGVDFEQRVVIDVISDSELRVHRAFDAPVAGAAYTLVPDLAGGNLTQRALERWDEATALLEELIAGVQAPVMEAIGGNPNDLRVTIGEGDAVFEGLTAYTSFPLTNTGPIEVRRNDSPPFPLYKRVGQDYASGEADPNEGIIIQFREALGGWLAIGRGGPAGATGPAPTLTGTSTTSLAVGTGTKVFTTQAGIAFTLGTRVRAASDDGTIVMDGEVTAYAGTSLTLDVDYTEGAGTHADWNLSIVGERGATGATGATGDIGPTGATGATGAPGGGIAIELTLDLASQADADPGAGKIRFNNATVASATQAFVDLTDSAGNDITTQLDSLDDSTSTTNKGRLRIFKRSDPSRYWTFALTAVTSATGYRKLTLTGGAASASLPVDVDAVVLAFTEKGDAGNVTIGDGDVTNAKLADMATDTIKGRVTTTTGDPEDIAINRLLSFNPRIINGTLSAAAASNALTIALKTLAGTDPSTSDPVYVLFPTATGGASMVKVTAPVSLTLANGSTMGVHANNLAFNLWVALFNNAGTVVIGAILTVEPTFLDIHDVAAAGFSATTAQSGANADTAQVWWSTDALAAATPYVTLGYINFATGLAAAGVWAANPTNVYLYGPGIKLPGEVLRTLNKTMTAEGSVSGTTYTTMGLDKTLTLRNQANLVKWALYGSLYVTNNNVVGAVAVHRNGSPIGVPIEFYASNSAGITAGAASGTDRPNINTAVTYDPRLKVSVAGTTVEFPENSTSNAYGGPSGLLTLQELQT